ncbi:hypothetical protein BURKHO8Y_140566 [Burkholderia sp. 8Y]|nr:hypothetical protein BURKHO8Y_140566 [Burkholderia sp. 8Y]
MNTPEDTSQGQRSGAIHSPKAAGDETGNAIIGLIVLVRGARRTFANGGSAPACRPHESIRIAQCPSRSRHPPTSKSCASQAAWPPKSSR